ncbi:U3 snoRNP protein [Coemansia sp. RSA 1933]|nr:U3 snoRNP protein [Coemansia sp. RSA 1933]
MAEVVQYHLEQMVPELEDLERKGIFDKQDLRGLVKKRTKFEYALKRRRVGVSDFLRYIEYEMNVNALRRERKHRLKIRGKTTVSDYSIDQRIISIFERALVRHSQDKSLWLQFIAFVKGLGTSDDGNGYSRLLSRIHARAITSHPYDAKMWIVAADNQFRDNGNGGAARKLMQRALRVNPKSKMLWMEYYRLELLLVEKIKARRRVLGIDGQSNAEKEEEDEGFINLPELDEEKKASASMFDEIEEHIEAKALESETQNQQQLTDEQREAMATKANPYLQGAIAEIVYDQAIAAIPSDLEFCEELAAIAAQFPEMEQQRNHVLQTISRDFADDPTATAYLCTVHLSGISLESPDLVDALRTAVAKFQASKIDTPEMWVLYIQFLKHWHSKCADIASLASYFSVLLKRAHSAVCEDKDNRLNSEVALLLLDNIDDKDEKLLWLEEMTARFPASCDLWLQRMELLTKKSSSGGSTEQKRRSIERIFETQALVACGESQELWTLWYDWIERENSEGYVPASDVQKKYLSGFMQTARLTSASSGLKELLQIRLVDWASRTGGLEAMRSASSTVSRQAFPTLGFYRRCMELEPDAKHRAMLHEFACRVNEADMEPWLAYLAFLTKQRRLEDAASVFWRASKALASDDDRTLFDSRYQALLH